MATDLCHPLPPLPPLFNDGTTFISSHLYTQVVKKKKKIFKNHIFKIVKIVPYLITIKKTIYKNKILQCFKKIITFLKKNIINIFIKQKTVNFIYIILFLIILYIYIIIF